MAVVKVIELLGESEESWEDATRQVVAEATKTLHGVTSVYVKGNCSPSLSAWSAS